MSAAHSVLALGYTVRSCDCSGFRGHSPAAGWPPSSLGRRLHVSSLVPHLRCHALTSGPGFLSLAAPSPACLAQDTAPPPWRRPFACRPSLTSTLPRRCPPSTPSGGCGSPPTGTSRARTRGRSLRGAARCRRWGCTPTTMEASSRGAAGGGAAGLAQGGGRRVWGAAPRCGGPGA